MYEPRNTRLARSPVELTLPEIPPEHTQHPHVQEPITEQPTFGVRFQTAPVSSSSSGQYRAPMDSSSHFHSPIPTTDEALTKDAPPAPAPGRLKRMASILRSPLPPRPPMPQQTQRAQPPPARRMTRLASSLGQQKRTGVDGEIVYEFDKDRFLEYVRYGLYVADFVTGMLMWGGTTAMLSGNVLTDETCVLKSHAHCAIVITFGVILMVLLFSMIGWHSVKYFEKRWLPYRIEMFVFAAMSVVWFALGIFALAGATAENKAQTDVEVVIVGGWLAGVSHLASAGLAALQRRSALQEAETVEVPAVTQESV